MTPASPPDDPPARVTRSRLLVGLVALAVVALIVGVSVASRSGGDVEVPEPAAEETDESVELRSQWELGAEATPEQLTAEQDLITATRAALWSITDTDDAVEAGYVLGADAVFKGDGLAHWLHPDHVEDDRLLDPERPESLVVRPSTGDVVGAMFISWDDLPQPGPNAVWHRHRIGSTVCFPESADALIEAGQASINGTQFTDEPPCRDGFRESDTSPFMFHVWLVETNGGPFADDMDFATGDTATRLR